MEDKKILDFDPPEEKPYDPCKKKDQAVPVFMATLKVDIAKIELELAILNDERDFKNKTHQALLEEFRNAYLFYKDKL